jgi:hypothetical protein
MFDAREISFLIIIYKDPRNLNVTAMRKKLTTLLFIIACYSGWGQVTLLVNNFEFTGNLTANGWTAHSSSALNPIATTTGLTFTGYSGSGIGNGASIKGLSSSEDVNITFSSQNTNGQNIYASFLVNVNDISTTAKTGDYFFHLGSPSSPNTTFTAFAARVFAKFDATGNVNFGLSNTSTATYGTTNFSKNTTYLIILKYTITSGTGADPLSLWVFSQGQDFSTEPSSGAEVVNTTTNGTDAISGIGLRQGGANQPEVIIDGIRIATSWDRVLPVNFTSFSSYKDGKNNLLTWSTASEQNNSGFEIQRSTDAANFEKLGFVKSLSATGNSSSRLDYTFTDYNPVGLRQYYRLKQTDFDGTSKYSAVVLVTREAPTALQLTHVYPNPSRESLYINTASPTKMELQLLVIDLGGRVVGKKQVSAEIGNNGFDIPVAHLASGSYILKVLNSSQQVVATEKFIKQ